MPKANATSLLAIHGAHRDFCHAKALSDDLREQVVWIAVALPEPLPAHRPKGATVERDVAALRVRDTCSQRAAREPREHVVAGKTMERHVHYRSRPREAVAFHEVGLVVEERREHARQIFGRHLPISGQHDSHIRVSCHRKRAARRDGGTHAEIGTMRDELEATRARTCCMGRAIRAPVVYDDDLVDVRRNRLESGADELCLVVSRHHRGDRSAFQHSHAVAIVSHARGQALACHTAGA